MKTWAWALIFSLLVAPAMVANPPQGGKAGAPPMPWAYGFATPPKPGDAPPPAAVAANPPDNVIQKHIEGSPLAFTQQQIGNNYGPADWFPGDHPQMPDIVAQGKRADMVAACSLCHYPNGKGRAENAGVAGLPYDYIVQTLNDFKNGARGSADPRKANTIRMIGFTKVMSDAEIKAAAQYFSSMKWTPWIKVVETKMVPKTRIAGGLFLTLDGNDKEPIGKRIIEVPVNTEATETLRNPHSTFIAYAPIGSIKRGERLVTTGGGKTIPCGACHGAELQGLGPIPSLAGRSPSYLARQLYDIQNGFRHGAWTDLMKPVVAKLTPDDMIAIVAYVSSRPAVSSAAAGSTSASGSRTAGAANLAHVSQGRKEASYR